jgi:hypothetical protein
MTLLLLLLLMLDPMLPRTPGGARAGRLILVDASLSMTMPAGATASRWAEAVRLARREQPARGEVMLFGEEPVSGLADSLGGIRPLAARSRLLPALQAAAEAGVSEVTILTDGAIEDVAEVTRWLPRLGLELNVQSIGGAVNNRGVTEVRAPAWVEIGRPVEIEIGVASVGAAGDSVIVSALDHGRVMAQSTVVLPGAGRVAATTLRFDGAPQGAGTLARYDLVIQGGDAVPDDDTRTVYVEITKEPAGVALVSLRPDWEPRFLQPVLERALGLPLRGFLRTGPDTWVRGGTGSRAGARATEQEVRDAVARAGLVVVHAYGDAAPSWVRDAVATARRVLVLPALQPGRVPLPVAVGSAIEADWYVSEELPPSPIAQHLAGMEVRDVPPLPVMHLIDEEPGVWAPAHVSRGRRGAAYPLALGGQVGNRRWVIALGAGYWRWAFRGGPSRDVYERLWSALSGWLVEERSVAAGEGVTPIDRVIARGTSPRWITTGYQPDSARVRLRAESGEIVLDTILPASSDTLAARPVEPGHYEYELELFGSRGSTAARGPITVESFSPEFTRPSVDASRLEASMVALNGTVRGPRVPLRTSAWPWVLVALLLSAEWVLRRRWGLR